jgi:hypothetical protein
MAGTSSVRVIAAKPNGNARDRKLYAAAVISGIYASTGRAILHAKNHEYRLALKNARRVAFDQADEMVRG